MPLQKQSTTINFANGVDTKTDPRQVSLDKFQVLNNSVFSVGGQLTKRNGFPSLGTTINSPSPALTYSNLGGSLTSARKVMAFKDELLVNDAFNLYSYDSAGNSWNYKGRNTMVGLSTTSIVAGKTTWTQCDSSVDTTTGVKVYAFSDGTTVRYSLQDTATGQFLINQASFGASYTRPRCVSISGKSWITAVNTSDGKIYYQAIVGQTVTGSLTALVTNLYVAYSFSVTPASATVGATYTNGGQTFTVLATISGGTTLVATGTGAPGASGTLTKASGTGDATITFTSFTRIRQNYDIDVDPATGNIYIAYFNNSPGLTISAISSSFVVGNTITESESASNGISFFGDGTNIWVVYNNGAATKGFIVNNAVSGSHVLAPTTIDSGATALTVNNVTGTYSSTQSKAFIFYDPLVQTSAVYTVSAVINFNTMTVAGSVGTPAVLMGSLSINSKAFSISGIPHIVGLYTELSQGLVVVQSTNFLINLYNVTASMGSSANTDVIGNIAAKISPDEASVVAPSAGFVNGIHQNASGTYSATLLQAVNYAFSSTDPVSFFTVYLAPTGVIDCAFDFTLTNPDAQDLGNNLNIASGQVAMYDGASVVEQNFHIYPNASTAVTADTGGNLGSGSADTIYSYIYTYEWIDNHGQVHRSFPSPVVTALASGHTYSFASGTTSGQVTLTLPCLRVTNKPGTQVVINVYRTLANGSVYYLTGGGLYGTAVNDPSANSVSYVDTASDTTIEANIQLYTTGALGYFAPPATRALSTFKNRLLAVPFEGGTDFFYSNQVLPNFPVQFVPFFDQNMGSIGGSLTTLAGMDDKIIIFRSGKITGPAILYMVGQGPSPSGNNNDFSDPLPVAVDVGCVDRPSVVLTPVGLMFKSNKGIYLLDRGLNASYVGAPVESYNSYSVLSAQLIPNTTQVRFLLSSGTLLMYDYYYKQWGTFTNPAGISDCIFQGQHTYVSSAGIVYKESPGTYTDGTATSVLRNFTTAWVQLAGLQGYQRAYYFYFLAQYLSSHTLTVNIYYDYDSTTIAQTLTITPGATDPEQWRVFLSKQKCQAFQISLQENASAGAGFTMSGVDLVVGVKKGYTVIPSARSQGA